MTTQILQSPQLGTLFVPQFCSHAILASSSDPALRVTIFNIVYAMEQYSIKQRSLFEIYSSVEIPSIFGTSEWDVLMAAYQQLDQYTITQKEYGAIKQCCMTESPLSIVNTNALHFLFQVVSGSSSIFCRELLLQDLLSCMSNETKKSNMK